MTHEDAAAAANGSSIKEQMLRKLAADIENLAKDFNVHSIQYVTYSTEIDSDQEAPPLEWRTLSRQYEKYKLAVEKFVYAGKDDVSDREIEQTLSSDEWLKSSCWMKYGNEHNSCSDIGLIDYQYHDNKAAQSSAIDNTKTTETKLNEWHGQLAIAFNDNPFYNIWIPQPYHDSRFNKRQISHIFLIVVPKNLQQSHIDIFIESINHKCREFIINDLVEHFCNINERLAAFRLKKLSDQIDLTSPLEFKLIKESTSEILKLIQLSTVSRIPISICGKPGAGKSHAARSLIDKYHNYILTKEADKRVSRIPTIVHCNDTKSVDQFFQDPNGFFSSAPFGIIFEDIHLADLENQRNISHGLSIIADTILEAVQNKPIIITIDYAADTRAALGRFSNTLLDKISLLKITMVDFAGVDEITKLEIANTLNDALYTAAGLEPIRLEAGTLNAHDLETLQAMRAAIVRRCAAQILA